MNEKRNPERQGEAANAGMRRALLEVAHRHAQRGQTYLVTERYLKLMQEHPCTAEGEEARQALLDLARRYEAEGKRYHALSLYDKVAARLAATKPPGNKDESPVSDRRPQREEGKAAAQEAVVVVREEASRRIHEKEGEQEHNPQRMDEIPFVDLTEDVHIAQNFERLGRAHRVRAEMLHQTVDSLTKLKE